MRLITVSIFIGLVIGIYGLLNFYIGLRGWQFLGEYTNFIDNKVYWTFFWLTAMSYILGRLGEAFLPAFITHALKIIGSYWLAVMFYLALILLIIDIGGLLLRFLNLSQYLNLSPILGGTLVLCIVSGIILYGSWNAKNPQLVKYEVNIPKKAGQYSELNIVLVSDIHLGTIVNNCRLEAMVEKINDLNPDLVMLAGDIIDVDVKVFLEQQMVEIFKKLKSNLGVYAALGNHEYIGGKAEETVHYLEEAGIKVLRDSFVEVAESFYIIGRDDLSRVRFTGKERKNLSSIMEEVDRTKPVFLLDHQPSHLEEALIEGVDLQLSGHTHRGQLFPNHLITQKIFENDWGYFKKDNLQVIVTSGYGTWGPPIRVGNKPELVYIKVKFNAAVIS